MTHLFQKQNVHLRNTSLLYYDRWGEEMFASEDPTKSWDGTFKSEKCSTGVYIWILTFTTIWEGAVVDKQINGNVTITR
jgi:hypothetical protein